MFVSTLTSFSCVLLIMRCFVLLLVISMTFVTYFTACALIGACVIKYCSSVGSHVAGTHYTNQLSIRTEIDHVWWSKFKLNLNVIDIGFQSHFTGQIRQQKSSWWNYWVRSCDPCLHWMTCHMFCVVSPSFLVTLRPCHAHSWWRADVLMLRFSCWMLQIIW